MEAGPFLSALDNPFVHDCYLKNITRNHQFLSIKIQF